MAENHKTTPATPKGKKPYTKPSVSSEPIYETSALACLKQQTGPSCASNKKAS